MPVNPRAISMGICLRLIRGKHPSILKVMYNKKNEAIKNLRNAAMEGSTDGASNFPAMKVPPQKRAVINNFRYVIKFNLGFIIND